MKNVAFFLILILLASCGNGKVDTSKLQEEMKSREIRRIPEATIIEQTLALGDSLIKELDLEQALLQSGTPISAWKNSYGVVLATAYSFRYKNDLGEKEAAVFEAYKYNAENSIQAEPNVQKLPDDVLAYNAPIMEDGKLTGMWSLHFARKYVVMSIED